MNLRGEVIVPKTVESVLNLTEVETYIRQYEGKYQISTEAFLREGSESGLIPEDDAFRWLAFVDLKREIEAVQEELHGEYLSCLDSPNVELSNSYDKNRFDLLAA
jgi:hypothetical protein